MCGIKCMKYLLFVFNFFFWLAGFAILGIGIWTKVDAGQFDSFLGNSGYSIPATTMMAAGSFVMVVGFLGCCGAIKENRCMLATFFALLLIIFCAEVAAGILGFIYRDKVEDEIQKTIKEDIRTKYGFKNAVDNSINILQQRLKCCGATDKKDWLTSKWKIQLNPKKLVPLSCCTSGANTTTCYNDTTYAHVYAKGCNDELKAYVDKHMILIGAVAVGISIIQLLGMIFSCCLFCSIDV